MVRGREGRAELDDREDGVAEVQHAEARGTHVDEGNLLALEVVQVQSSPDRLPGIEKARERETGIIWASGQSGGVPASWRANGCRVAPHAPIHDNAQCA